MYKTSKFPTKKPNNSHLIQIAPKRNWSNFQKDIFRDIANGTDHTVVIARAGSGKCLGKGTPVLLFNGAIKSVEEIKEGDALMGPDSKPRKVLSTNIGKGELVSINPIKGDSWICNTDHILTLIKNNYGKEQIKDISVINFIEQNRHLKSLDKNWKLLRAGVNFKEKVIPFDPYFLGMWIGNGTFGKTQITNAAHEIIDYCNSFATKLGIRCKPHFESHNNCYRIEFSLGDSGVAHRGTFFALGRFLRNDCVLNGHKHIPDIYLTNSRDCRLQLLAGLIDTEGNLHENGEIELVAIENDLANQYCFLARSLGYAAYKHEKETSIKSIGYKEKVWTVIISGDLKDIPVKISKKIYRTRQQIKNHLCTGFDIKSIGVGDYYGFTLDGDGRFLLGDFTVTHNTSTIVEGFKYIPRGKKTLMVAFNKSIADELKQRAPSYVDVMTLHSLGFRAIKQSFGNVILENDKCSTLVKDIIGDDYELWELNQNICKCVSLCKGFLFDTPAKIEDLIDRFGIETFDLDRPTFIQHTIKALGKCKETKMVIDFDDMIWFPFVFRLNVGKFDVVFVDEAQDLNAAQIAMVLSAVKPDGRIIAVGDPAQCVDEKTMVNVDGIWQSVRDCKIGQSILCYNNGKLDNKSIIEKRKSTWEYGYEITTYSGKKLLMSPNHKIWAASPVLDNQYIVYLMYRSDLGFRVGKTNTCKNINYPFGLRANSENAEKFWVLDIVSTNDEALLLEETYSLKYGIPTSVFNGTHRNINQARLNNIFKEFGKNGLSLLLEKNLHVQYPHWIASSNSNVGRRTIRLNAHSKKGTQVTLEWKDDSLDKIFTDHNISFSKGKNSIIRKYFRNYTDALSFANMIKLISNAEINERLSICGENPYLITASGLHKGMKVYSLFKDFLIEDTIIDIRIKEGIFYDLQVEESANFIGNDILSHNSIYQFRGADSDAIPNVINKLKAKTLPLSVTYRCPKKIVRLAQEIVPDIEAHAEAEDGLVVDLDVLDLLKNVKPGDFVLSRTNAPLIKHCLALLKSGVPANIQGRDIGANLLYFIKKSKAKTINSFITYVNTWQDNEVKRLMTEKRDTTICIDKAECLLNLCEGVLTIKDLKETIESLFNDTNDAAKVIFSTTHKAKGLERDRVFILADTYRQRNGGEEANLWYVAVTRAKKELYLVRKASKYTAYDDKPKTTP